MGRQDGPSAGALYPLEVYAVTPEGAYHYLPEGHRTAVKYGERAERYVHLEAGHVAQNVLLQAAALGLGGVPIGAFSDRGVQRALGLPADHEPLYLIPVGHPTPA